MAITLVAVLCVVRRPIAGQFFAAGHDNDELNTPPFLLFPALHHSV